MFRVALIPGALILSALLLAQPPAAPPAAEPAIRERAFSWFSLTESPDQVRAILGRPALAASTGADYLSWQFQIGEIEVVEAGVDVG